MAVLYQKYRPQRFAEVVGQDPIVRILQNAATSGQLAHAYLLTGSRGIGKTTIARLIAKAANCQSLDNGDPCGTCTVCTAIASDNFLDVIEIDAASHTGVDNVRDLIEHVQFKPSYGHTKVFIIDEVHMLSKAAFNALLKTLEEPPSHALFILATTDIEKVPDTIVSRTQRLDFRKITPEAMQKALEHIVQAEKITIPEGALPMIIANSEGGMRDALSLLDTVASLGSTSTTEQIRTLMGLTSVGTIEELVGMIVSHSATTIPAFFDNLNSQGIDFVVFNKNLLEYLRLMLVAKVTHTVPENTFLEPAHHGPLQIASDRMSMPQLLFVIRLFLRSYKEIGQSPSPELPLLLASVEASLHGTAATAPAPKAAASSIETPLVSKPATTPPPVAPFVFPIERAASSVMRVQSVDSSVDTTVTKEEAESWWPDVVQHIKTFNSPLATLLKNSPLQEVVNGRITIGVKYLFHKENLENTKNIALILDTLQTVSGKQLTFRAVIVKELQEPTLAQTVDALGDAIKIFGGELVE